MNISQNLSDLDSLFLFYFSLINAVYFFLLILGSIRTFIRNKELSVESFQSILHSNALPEVTFIVPMYNEEKNIMESLNNLVNLTYRYKRIIVINDGSTDQSMQILKENLDLVSIPKFYEGTIQTEKIKGIYRSKVHKEIIVLDKEHAGKFDGVNAGINACLHPFFVVVDADTLIDDKEFEAFIRPILSKPEVIGIGAGVRIKNGCTLNFNMVSTVKFPKDILPAFQFFEYLRSFSMRQGWDWVGGNFVIAGAFSVFQTELIKEVGGFSSSIAEDMEIVVRLHHFMHLKNKPYRILYLPDPVAWTNCPSKLKSLGKQRTRWHLGLLETLWYHKKICFNPKYGIFGLFNYPFWIACEAFEPVMETLGFIIILGSWFFQIINTPFFLLLVLITLGFTFVYSTFCILLEELTFRRYTSMKSVTVMILLSFIENIGYRQLTIYWRLKAFFLFLKNFKKIRLEGKRIEKLLKLVAKRPI
jgi:cellulose synthase/poly-beta-1,6-N-acetylglucosamine synthase-like glycosyltransferase